MASSLGARGVLGRVLAGLAGVALLGGCAAAPSPGPGGQVAAPEPARLARLVATPPPPDLGTVERYAWMGVVQLGEDFAAGNADAFLARISSGFYRGYPALEAAIRTLFAATSAREVVVAVREVSSEGDRVSVRAEWSRTLSREGGAPEQLRGETVFLFLRSETSLRLLDYRGAAPFGIEGI